MRKFDNKEIAKWIENSVKQLIVSQEGCGTLKLDDHLAICTGWSAGYGEEKRDDVIQAKDEPDFAICVGLKVWTSDDLRTDFDYINFPYYEDGECADYSVSIFPNEDYEKLFDRMFTYNEDIARYDNYRFVRATAGMSMEKLKALTLDRPSQHDEVIKYGWASKQLHHILRLNSFLKRWVTGEPFKDCLIDPRSDYLKMIKQDGHSMFTLDEAQIIAKHYDDETNAIKDQYIATHEHIINDAVGRMVNDIVVDVVRESLKKEIG